MSQVVFTACRRGHTVLGVSEHCIATHSCELRVRSGISGRRPRSQWRYCSSRQAGLSGIATKPWRATEAERSLAGRKASDATFRDAAEIALTGAVAREHNHFKI